MDKKYMPLALAAWLIAISLVAEEDIKDEEKQATHYETMVCSGYWLDYKKLTPECSYPDASGP